MLDRLDFAVAVDPACPATVFVAGEVDMGSAPALLDALLGAGGDSVLVDLSEVTFLDSSGIRVLIDARAQIVQSGRSLSVTGLSPRVRQVFEITGLLGLFEADAVLPASEIA